MTFIVPKFDMEIMRDEYESDQPIQVKSYAQAVKNILSLRELALQSFREHITDEWREIVRQR